MKFLRSRAALLVLLTITTMLMLLSLGVTSAAAATLAHRQIQVEGYQLTSAQIAAVNKATRTQRLNWNQLQAVIAHTSGISQSTRPYSGGHVFGPCGTADLYGDSSGYYDLILNWNWWVGPPTNGEVTISTNGSQADQANYFFYDGTPSHQDIFGQLSFIGYNANQTTANGWALTFFGWVCGINVTTAAW